jgi:hypothetical protein
MISTFKASRPAVERQSRALLLVRLVHCGSDSERPPPVRACGRGNLSFYLSEYHTEAYVSSAIFCLEHSINLPLQLFLLDGGGAPPRIVR